MAIQTSIRISINGEPITKFSRLGIKQGLLSHHTFFVRQPLPKAFITGAIDKAQEYVGQQIHIKIEPKNIKSSNTGLNFKGLVTDVDIDRSKGAAGEIVISGTSPTIKMDGVANTRSYINKEFSAIIGDTMGSHKESMNLKMQINRDTALDYTVQYKESDFGFLCRMAQKKGEWFYYNGAELVFGKPQSQSFALVYGQNVTHFKRHMGIKPLGFQYTGYDPEAAQTQKMSSGEINYESQGLAQAMLQTSKRVFPDNGAAMYYHHPITAGNAQSHLHDRVKTQLQGKASGLVTAKGISTETGLRIGDIVNVKEPRFSLTGDLADGVREESFGNYYVTSIAHVCDETGNYSNEFHGVPDTVEAPPYTNVLTPPVAETQPAVVTDNNDPKGLGRVKVKFHWDYESPWIRMTQPHGGGSKGFYFIPEIGEEVLVAYEGGNAEKPYIVGTMYNGSQKSGYATANNDLKVIHSRSGTKIKMNDAEGSIFIEDPSGNTWFMDGKGNIDVTAPETIRLNGKNIELNAHENIKAKAGEEITNSAKNISDSAMENHNTMARNKNEIIDENIVVNARKTQHTAEEVAVSSTAKNMTLFSEKSVDVQSNDKVNLF
ncbi:type VI secretion system Vgr family protein [Sinomicrobium weinanense]|uniref:Gp5/Type VI secretion system Vgr protein OB-fold domain-containing protein n=1 Tax=Sinomicrobium weinanense TaxID=2842200 RepID=A0A926JQ35_9FLAO|nr:phage baseplate assembly protein V [Sinomicrobium weinanense]MBC9795243.1 hypothetical protein [Sinomicrobium weinanense]MBU3122020.1 hypothetical protein [Sinomicrobium weinanense]